MKLSISLPDELVARMDAVKGDLVPRSTWIAMVVEQALAGGSGRVDRAAVSEFESRTPASPAEPLSRAEMFRRATQK